MISIKKIQLTPEDLTSAVEVLKSGWLMQGSKVKTLEENFAQYTQSRFASACSNGTSALHLALEALRLKPGSKVIVPAFSWLSTANAVLYANLEPVFCDISLETFNISITELEKLISPEIKAIIPVHQFGNPAEMQSITALAKKHDIKIIEDAACAMDAKIGNTFAGTIGDSGTFSFHPRKAITSGEGGMVLSQNEALDKILKSLRNHGFSDENGENEFDISSKFSQLGYNYRMTDIQASLLISQLKRAPAMHIERQKVAKEFSEKLKNIKALRLPTQQENTTHGWQSYVCLVSPEEPTLQNISKNKHHRDSLIKSLETAGIQTRFGSIAIPETNFYSGKYSIAHGSYPNALIAQQTSIALPIYDTLTPSEIDYITSKLTEYFND